MNQETVNNLLLTTKEKQEKEQKILEEQTQEIITLWEEEIITELKGTNLPKLNNKNTYKELAEDYSNIIHYLRTQNKKGIIQKIIKNLEHLKILEQLNEELGTILEDEPLLRQKIGEHKKIINSLQGIITKTKKSMKTSTEGDWKIENPTSDD